MDYEYDGDQGLGGGAGGSEKIVYVEKPRKASVWRILWRIIFVLSIVANMFMFLLLIAFSASAVFATGHGSLYVEETLVKGDRSNKVVVIALEGVINGEMSGEVCKQIAAARDDGNIKALIIRTNTPGGGVAASDQIYHEIKKFRKETGIPVVAFMQSIAASGGVLYFCRM